MNEAPAELPILLFAQQEDWAAWLAANHGTAPGLWLRLAKKATGIASITYGEALDVALCYGWIDSHKRGYDEASWVQKFTPRRARSIWSRVNVAKAEALLASGQMQQAGLLEMERAKADGRWDAAYDSQRTMAVPDDLQDRKSVV